VMQTVLETIAVLSLVAFAAVIVAFLFSRD
jgi:hypothetical protein